MRVEVSNSRSCLISLISVVSQASARMWYGAARCDLDERRSCMRIAQVAPMYEAVPPHRYGGTERVVSYLTEELVRRGHDVTLFASGDSRTSARLVPTTDRALRERFSLQETQELAIPLHQLMLGEVLQRA